MSKPRVFVSSTYYDLKHVRSSLENFIEELGYEPILSEKGDIAYAPDIALDESCYREVRNSDIFVLIIGGRYGAEKSAGKGKVSKEFYDRYDSITKQEYANAIARDIPIYILIEKAVYADFETYLRNKLKKGVSYAHVDSVNIFRLIEEVLSQPRNNPLLHFDRYADIEAWLQEQWAGLFKELLSRMSSHRQISSLSSQVSELSEINKTLKSYLEQVVAKIAPEESAKIIRAESKRLDEALQKLVIERNSLTKHLQRGDIPIDAITKAAVSCDTFDSFTDKLLTQFPKNKNLLEVCEQYRNAASRDFELIKMDLKNPEAALQKRELKHPSKDVNHLRAREKSAVRQPSSTEAKVTVKKAVQGLAKSRQVSKR